jgi:hypothetical protein
MHLNFHECYKHFSQLGKNTNRGNSNELCCKLFDRKEVQTQSVTNCEARPTNGHILLESAQAMHVQSHTIVDKPVAYTHYNLCAVFSDEIASYT